MFDINKLKIKFEIGDQIGEDLEVQLIYDEKIISSDSVEIAFDDICSENVSFRRTDYIANKLKKILGINEQ